MRDDEQIHGGRLRHGLRDRMLAIRSFESFRGLDDDGLTLLAEHARDLTLSRGSVITNEGDTGRALYLVLKGKIQLSRKGKTIGAVESGQSLGLLTSLARMPAAHAVAEIDTRLLEIPIEVYLAALEENFSLLRTSIRLICAAVLKMRGNLPVHPSMPVAAEPGEYYERPSTLVERILDVRTMGPVQSAVNVEAVVELARRTQEIRVPEGHLFWSVGEPATYSLRIGYGLVRCTSEDGRHVLIGKSFNIGSLDSWSGQPRTYAARTETPVIAYKTGLEDFATMMENHLDVALAFLHGMARALEASQSSQASQA